MILITWTGQSGTNMITLPFLTSAVEYEYDYFCQWLCMVMITVTIIHRYHFRQSLLNNTAQMHLKITGIICLHVYVNLDVINI